MTQESKKQKNTNIDNFKLGTSGAVSQEKGACEGLRVDMSGVNGCSEDAPGPSRGCAADVEGAAARPEEVGAGSGVLFADVNLLREEREKEKAMKNSLSLSFKNNILRTEAEHPGPNESGKENNLCGKPQD